MPVMATRPTQTITNNFAVAGTCDSTASACALISVLLQKCSRFRFGLLRSSQRQQRAQPLVPQVQARPDKDCCNDGGGISRVADALVRGHRTAEITRHKNGAVDGGSRSRHFGSLCCCRHAALPFLITPN